MSAVNPTPPNATPDRSQRPYEPSMEEILASIRRIIADDQSLPGRGAEAAPAPVAAPEPPPVEPTTVHILRPAPSSESALPLPPAPQPLPQSPSEARAPEPALVEATRPQPAPTESRLSLDEEAIRQAIPSMFAAHGTIAPQFAMPDSPAAASADTNAEHDFVAAPERYAEPAASQDPPPRPAFMQHAPVAPEEIEQPAFDEPFEPRSVYDRPLGRHEPEPFEPAPLFSAATDQALTSAFNTLAATRLANNSDDLLSMTREMIRPLLKTWLDENLPSMVERLVRAEIERVARGGR